MLQYKIDILSTTEENVKALLGDDPILYTFDVIPLDYNVLKTDTPKVYISLNKFVFTYDELIEIHEIESVEFEVLGDEPQFKLVQQLTESSYTYLTENRESYTKLKTDETFTRLSYTEVNSISKSIVLRLGQTTAKPYQTWAMSQIILNIKNRIPRDVVLDDMLIGNFIHFNTSLIVFFMIIVIAYFAIHFMISSVSNLISTILDFVFAGILIAMGSWVYLEIEGNNKTFFNTYIKYRPIKSSEIITSTGPVTKL
jgi:hypothetical protein